MNPWWAIPGFLGDESHFGETLRGLSDVRLVSPLKFSTAPDLLNAARALAQEAFSSGRRPHLVGYSMGARLALMAAAMVPGAFASVTAVSPHPGFAREDERLQRIEEDKAWARLLIEDWNVFWEKWNQRGSLAGTPSPVRPVPSMTERRSWAGILVNWSTGSQGFLPELLKDTPAAIQLVIGEDDRTFVNHSRLFPCRIKRVFIPNAGHRVPLSTPEQLAATLRAFAAENP